MFHIHANLVIRADSGYWKGSDSWTKSGIVLNTALLSDSEVTMDYKLEYRMSNK